MSWYHPSAKALHRKKVVCGQQQWSRASLFPMFTPEGDVRYLLMIVPDTGGLYWMPWHPGTPYRAGFFTLRIGRSDQRMRPLEPDDLASMEHLLHYDPWWLLDRPAFASHWAVPALKKTNCLPYITADFDMLHFAPDLSRVSKVSRKNPDGSHSYEPWQRDRLTLPAESLSSSTRSAKLRWVLDPVWQKA